MKHNIALIGFGTVGQGIADILLTKKESFKTLYNFEFEIVAIADMRFGNCYNPTGLNVASLLDEIGTEGQFCTDLYKSDIVSLIKFCNADIVCEMTYTDLQTGGDAVDFVKAALSTGKNVVTSNKGPAALCFQELEKMADENKVNFMIEGTVVAGTPVLNLIRDTLKGCEISKIRGILNGTTNYILTQMESGMSYESALKIAQELGYAEADPAGDVEGFDARAKVCILANAVMNLPVKLSQIDCKGISHITLNDVQQAKNSGKRWKLIGCIEKTENEIKASVAPEEITAENPLFNIMGTQNALTFTTDLLGDVTIVGPGAGKSETGFAILTDILSIHKKNNQRV
jgi:homoserine dehydrogenase